MEDEVILTAEIDRGQIIRGKYDLDVVGHYARPEHLQLHVDERPKRSCNYALRRYRTVRFEPTRRVGNRFD